MANQALGLDMVADETNPQLTQNLFPRTQEHAQNGTTPSTTSAETVRNPSPPSNELTAMDLAYNELRSTIAEATAARNAPNLRPRMLQSHIAALDEDAALLATFQSSDEAERTKATQIILQACRLKRHIERDLIDLELAESANVEQQVMQLVPFANEKNTGIKLAPIKPPIFAGDVAQFRIFREFFEENILNSSLTETAKWLRLTESVQGRPKELIDGIPQTAATLTIAWDLLKDVYGGVERPIVELYERLQRLQVATNVTSSIRLVHSQLEGILLSLEHLGHDVADNGYIRWVYMSKFPVEVGYEVKKDAGTSLLELRKKISKLLSAREDVDRHAGVGLEAPRVAEQQRAVPPFARRYQPQSVAVYAAPTNFGFGAAPSANYGVPTAASGAPSSSSNWADRRRQQPDRAVPASQCPFSCMFCAGAHWNDMCPVYPTINSRKQRIFNKCLTCLRREHPGAPCAVRRRCFHCDSFDHNRALCPVKFTQTSEQVPSVVQAAVISNEQHEPSAGFFLTFVAKAKSDFVETPIDLRVVVDTAGGNTVLRKEAAAKLKIPALKEATTAYTGLGDTKLATSCRLQGAVYLLPREKEIIEIHAEMVDWIIPEVPTADVAQFREQHPQYEHLYIPPTGEGAPIDLLIGSDALVDILGTDQMISVDRDTMLLPTRFGSLILGRQNKQQEKVRYSLLFNTLSHPLEQMSNLDLVGLTDINRTDIDDEQRAIQSFYKSVQFKDGRYSISWPWRTDPPLLDSNFGLALGRLRTLHRKLIHTPQLLQQYHQVIQTQLQDGIVEIVDSPRKSTRLVHYLPHHPVIQPEKSTSLRPVYDGSSRTAVTKKSLNDNLLKGKNWLTDLVATLVRFRRTETVVTADVAKAFHQISINQSDRDVVRFVWVKNPQLPPTDENLEIYRFTRVAFGLAPSPFILSATIQYHASKQEPHRFNDVILQDMYADNLVTALPKNEDPQEFYRHAKQFFSSMSMNLTKWATNKPEIRLSIPAEDQLTDPIQSVLGLRWNTQQDTLAIKQPSLPFNRSPTRRTVAAEMARYFDPLGWAIPIILLAKNFFRKVWQETTKWDEPLSAPSREEWFAIIEKLQQTIEIKIPRCYSHFEDADSLQLHCFVDASNAAYAVVVYLRAQFGAEVALSLVAARNRLKPVKKTVTIPKLELIAVLLGSRFVTFIKEALKAEKQIQTYVWSDSRCALAWVTQNKILPSVIEKYITDMKKLNVSEYRYVPSSFNFADIATRGGEFQTLSNMKWWTGPSWLEETENWPTDAPLPEPETKMILLFQQKLAHRSEIVPESEEGIATLNVKKYSSLTKLLTKTAYMLRGIQQLCQKECLQLQTEIDLQMAEVLWLRWDQRREYAIMGEPEAGKEFLLRNISVFRDADGLIRCTTRIVTTQANLDTVSPILLVKNSTLTKLIVMYVHLQHYHAGTNHTLAAVRQKYWLPHGRRQIYKIILNSCYKCKRQIALTYPAPPTAPLPEFRVLRSQRPFQITGVDIFGPVKVRHYVGDSHVEQLRYVVIFTCATIRAVHLEVITDMHTHYITEAFRKFFARRGVPSKIVSDNAGQFHELDGCMQRLWKSYTQVPEVSNYFAEQRVIWEFTVEYAPWMGGIYERLIQIIKKAFEKTYGSRILFSNQFEIAMIESEAILNARPIGYVDRDPETHILTPNDFLKTPFSAIPMNAPIEEGDDIVSKLWKSSQAYLEEFWKNWADQYLQILRERNDQLRQLPRSNKFQPTKGDVVILYAEGKRRSAWQTAIVERLIAGTDGIIRAAQVKLPSGGRSIRSLIHMAPLGLKVDLPRVSDQQLTRKRDALVVWPVESGSSQNQIREELAEFLRFGENAPNSERSNEERTSEEFLRTDENSSSDERSSEIPVAESVPITEQSDGMQPGVAAAADVERAVPRPRFRLPGNVVVWTTTGTSGS